MEEDSRQRNSMKNVPETCMTCLGKMSRARHLGFPGDASGQEPACQCRRLRDSCSIPGSGRSPGGGMATHSSSLAWRILWTEEAGGLQSTGSQRVGQD